jgi:hypothetical protein
MRQHGAAACLFNKTGISAVRDAKKHEQIPFTAVMRLESHIELALTSCFSGRIPERRRAH